jgi:hypothetical protein
MFFEEERLAPFDRWKSGDFHEYQTYKRMMISPRYSENTKAKAYLAMNRIGYKYANERDKKDYQMLLREPITQRRELRKMEKEDEEWRNRQLLREAAEQAALDVPVMGSRNRSYVIDDDDDEPDVDVVLPKPKRQATIAEMFSRGKGSYFTGYGSYKRRKYKRRRLRGGKRMKSFIIYNYLKAKKIPESVAQSIAMDVGNASQDSYLESQLSKRMRGDRYDEVKDGM